ncbi:MAG: hypothetical protein ACRENX_13165 [Candidatus Dormibacteria bacterium]
MGFKDLYKSLDQRGKAVAADLQAKAAEKAPMVDAKIAAAKEAASAAATRASEYGKEHGLGATGTATSTAAPATASDPSATNSSWVPPGVGHPGEGADSEESD